MESAVKINRTFCFIARLFQSSQINLLKDLQQHLIVLKRVSLRFGVEHQNERNELMAQLNAQPLIRFSRFDAQRQTLMKRALERLSAVEDLSKDLFEKIEKAL